MKNLMFAILISIFLFPSIAFSCIQSSQQTSEFLEICIGGNCKRIFLSDMEAKYHSESKFVQSAIMSEAFQRFFSFNILLSALDNDDPDKATNPDQPGFYWGDIDGNRLENEFDARYLNGIGCFVGVRYLAATDEFQICSEVVTENRTCP